MSASGSPGRNELTLPQRVYRFFLHGAVHFVERLGLTVSRVKDYYSPLPIRRQLLETRER